MKVIVVGGGIIGAGIALELAGSGAEVTLVERTAVGAEASGAAAGMLAPQGESAKASPLLELLLRSRTLYPKWVKGIEALSGLDVGYLSSGLLQVAFDDADAQALEARCAWQQASGLRAKFLTGPEAREREPALSPKAVAAAYFADDHQVDPRKLMAALALASARSAVTTRMGMVRSVLVQNGRVTGVDLEGEPLYAEVVVLAAGSWSALITNTGLKPHDIRPAKGQLVEVSMPMPLLTHIVKSASGYVVPRPDGRVLVGSTLEHVGFDTRVTVEGMTKMLSAATQLVPALALGSVRASWANFRPWAEDALPILGPAPLPGLVFATGHFRNGILLAPITAKVVAQIVHGEKPVLDVSPFQADRFSP